MRPNGYLTMCLLLVAVLVVPALPLFAQAAQDKTPQTKTPAEFNAYNSCYTEKDPAKKADLCEKFVDGFKDSDFFISGYKLIIQSYYQSQNWKLLMDAADRVGALPSADNTMKGYAYEKAMVAAENSNNIEKCVSYGDKVLAIDPENFNALYTVSTVIPQQYSSDMTQLVRAEDMARKALGLAASMMDKAKPEEKPQIALIDGNLHGTLGLISFHQKDYRKSIQEYQVAVKDNVKDDGSHFFMAFDYIKLMEQASQEYQTALKAENDAKAAKADQPTVDELGAKRASFADDVLKYRDTVIDELAITVAISGPYADQAKPLLTKQWTDKNNSTTGLDGFVSQKKAQVGG
jgi:tetratricopeptide (TPR) repeat protein